MMRFERQADLVLGMTLAEVFLLLLFVVWWSTVVDARPDGDPDATVEAVVLNAENEQLKARALELADKNAELEARLRTLRDMGFGGSGSDDIVTAPQDTFREMVKRRLDEAKRGAPVCLPDNLLASVERLDGIETLTVRRDTISLDPAGKWQQGAKLKDQYEIGAFISYVKRYYKQSRSKCRFDYRLTYRTDSDYREGRTRYESDAFYSGGIERRP